jgi:hypothetical protein
MGAGHAKPRHRFLGRYSRYFQKTMQWPRNSATWTAAAVSAGGVTIANLPRKLLEFSEGLHSPYRGSVGFLGAVFVVPPDI